MMKDRMPAPDWYRCPLGALAEIRGRDLARGVEAAHDHVGGAGEAGQAGPVAPVEPGRALVPDVGEPALGQDLEVVGDRGLPHADPVNDRPHAQRGVAGEEQAQDLRPDRVCERPEPARAGLGRPPVHDHRSGHIIDDTGWMLRRPRRQSGRSRCLLVQCVHQPHRPAPCHGPPQSQPGLPASGRRRRTGKALAVA
jgi:hypothetical protein